MTDDAEPYIAAVADACHAAGLIVADYRDDEDEFEEQLAAYREDAAVKAGEEE